MANKEARNSRYILNTWYIFDDNQSELNRLIGFLDHYPYLNLEFNTSKVAGSEKNPKISSNLTIENSINDLIMNGIEKSRVNCNNFTESNIPMFRIVRQI